MPLKGISVKNEPKHCVDDENAERSRMRGHHPKPSESSLIVSMITPIPVLRPLAVGDLDADLLGTSKSSVPQLIT
jgi:hypothetical protein